LSLVLDWGDSTVVSPVNFGWEVLDLELSVSESHSVGWWMSHWWLLLVLGSVSEKLMVLLCSPGRELVHTHLEASTIVLVVPLHDHEIVSEDLESELVLLGRSVRLLVLGHMISEDLSDFVIFGNLNHLNWWWWWHTMSVLAQHVVVWWWWHVELSVSILSHHVWWLVLLSMTMLSKHWCLNSGSMTCFLLHGEVEDSVTVLSKHVHLLSMSVLSEHLFLHSEVENSVTILSKHV